MSVVVELRFNHLPGASAVIRAEDDRIRRRGANTIYARSVPRTPVDTGALRGNVTIDANGVTWNQEYALFQELGTVRGIEPRLFATASAEETFPEMIADYRRLEALF